MAKSKITDIGTLKTTATRIHDIADEVYKSFIDIDTRVSETVGTDVMSGDRADAFFRRWNEFSEYFRPIAEQINDINQG